MGRGIKELFKCQTINDLLLNGIQLKVLHKIGESKTPLNCLFIGPPGTGKTTFAILLLRQVYQISDIDMLIFNASNQRGIEFIRDEVTRFAYKRPIDSDYRAIIFDEADYMTDSAFACLRVPMQELQDNCIFILTANYHHKIPNPIKSRCVEIEFDYEPDAIYTYIKNRLDSHEIKYNQKVVKVLVNRFCPDIRSIINKLDMAFDEKSNSIDNLIIINMIPDFDLYVNALLKLLKGQNLQYHELNALWNIKSYAIYDVIRFVSNCFNNSYPNLDRYIIFTKYASAMYFAVDRKLLFRAMISDLIKDKGGNHNNDNSQI